MFLSLKGPLLSAVVFHLLVVVVFANVGYLVSFWHSSGLLEFLISCMSLYESVHNRSCQDLLILYHSFPLQQLFSDEIKGFHTYRDSFLSTFCFRWLKMTGKEVRDVTGVTGFRFGILWSVLYTIYWNILALNIFRVVLMNGWADKAVTKRKTIWNYLWKVYFRPKNKVYFILFRFTVFFVAVTKVFESIKIDIGLT